MGIAHYSSTKLSLYHEEDIKRPVSVATKLKWTLPFCIVICSVGFLGKFVASGFVSGLDNGGGKRRSLCKKTLRSQDREIPLQRHATRL